MKVHPRLSEAQKRFRIARNYIRGYPVWCSWQVTYLCNFRCSFCHYWKERPVDEATLEDFRIGSEKLAEHGSFLVSLAGGEPFIRKDLAEIVSAVGRYHLPILATNGWLVTPERAKELFQASLAGISVSLDYIDPRKHDAQRGKDGAFKRAVQALQHLSEARFSKRQRVGITTVLHEGNLDDIEPLIRLAAKYNAHLITQPYSSMKTGDKNFLVQKEVSKHLLALKKKYKNFMSNQAYLSKFDDHFETGIGGCRAGQAFFNIDNFCQVSICVEMRHRSVGNLITDSLSDIFDAMQRQNETNTCRYCWYHCRGEIEVLYTLSGLRHFIPLALSS